MRFSQFLFSLSFLSCCLLFPLSRPANAAQATEADPCSTAFEQFARYGNVPKAIELYQKCVTDRPTARFPHYNLAILYESLEDWPKAQAEFEQYLKMDKESERAQLARTELGKIAHIEQLFTDPVTWRQYEHDEALSQARHLLSMGLYSQAFQQAQKAEQFSRGVDDYLMLAAIDTAQQRYEDAVEHLQKAQAKCSESQKDAISRLIEEAQVRLHFQILRGMGERAFQQKNYPQASELLTTAWKLQPRRTDVAFAAVTAILATPNYGQAIPILDALAKNSDTAISARAKHIHDDLVHINATVQENKAHGRQIVDELLARYNGGRKLADESPRSLAKLEPTVVDAVRLSPGDPVVLRLCAYIFAREGKWTNAEEQYEAILRIDPKANVGFWLARSLYKQGKYDEAEGALAMDLQNDPSGNMHLKRYLAEDIEDAKKKQRRSQGH